MLEFFAFFFVLITVFIFGCAGSSLLRRLFSSCSDWGAWGGGRSETLFFVAGVQASNFIGFSCCLLSTGSRLLGFRSCGTWAPGLSSGLVAPAACGSFPDQGWNRWRLHWPVDSQPLGHQGSPYLPVFADGGRSCKPKSADAL